MAPRSIKRPIPGTRGALVLVLILLQAACSLSALRPDPPQVSLADLRLEKLGVFEQRYGLTLRLRNPNDYPLKVAGLDFTVALNGRRFADGVAPDGFSLPANGESTVDVTVTSDLGSVLDLIREWSAGEQGLTYRLSGHARLADWGMSVPFERTGQLAPAD